MIMCPMCRSSDVRAKAIGILQTERICQDCGHRWAPAADRYVRAAALASAAITGGVYVGVIFGALTLMWVVLASAPVVAGSVLLYRRWQRGPELRDPTRGELPAARVVDGARKLPSRGAGEQRQDEEP